VVLSSHGLLKEESRPCLNPFVSEVSAFRKVYCLLVTNNAVKKSCGENMQNLNETRNKEETPETPSILLSPKGAIEKIRS
jgi:hypothetical protein